MHRVTGTRGGKGEQVRVDWIEGEGERGIRLVIFEFESRRSSAPT